MIEADGSNGGSETDHQTNHQLKSSSTYYFIIIEKEEIDVSESYSDSRAPHASVFIALFN